MLGHHALRVNEDELGDSDAGKMDAEGVHPVVIRHDWVAHSDVTAETCIEA
jgi:hypothetical protein